MSRKSLLLTSSIVLTLVGGLGVALYLLVHHEPDVYRRASVPPGPLRAQRSQEFYEEFSQLINSVQPGNEREWYIKLTDEQINSYFAEGFVQSGIDERVLPEGISEPRVVLEPDKVRMAFRYKTGPICTIVTIDLGVWLAKKEPNVVALELQGLHAGSLPISAQSLLNMVTETLRERNGIEMSWFRHPQTGNPVALLRFASDQPRATVQLQAVQVEQGSIVIRGKPVDGGSLRAMLFPGMEALLTE